MFFSLILPVYNVEKFLNRCVESIIRQGFSDYEIILVDDGSTDTSGVLCDQWAKLSDKILSVHKNNGGLASARNYGLKYATGEYVLFIDSDDWLRENALECCFAELQGRTIDVLKYGFQRVANGTYSEEIVSSLPEGDYERSQIENVILPQIVGPYQLFDYQNNPLKSAWSSVYRRTFLIENGILFESERKILNEDYLFALRVMLAANKVKVIHKALYYYDFREGSLSKRYIDNMLTRKLELQKYFALELQKYGLFSKYEKEYYSGCVDAFYACFTNECGKWKSDTRTAKKNVKKVLALEECKTALARCRHDNLSYKGNVIYYLMRFQLSALMVTLYRISK